VKAEVQAFSAKLREGNVQLRYLPRALGIVWTAARRWAIAGILLIAAQGVLPVATVYLTKLLVDSIVAAIGAHGGWESMRPAMILVGVMAGVVLLGELLRSLTDYVRAAQAELVHDHITGLIHEKSIAVDLAFYESPKYYDHLYRARMEATQRPVALLESLGSLLQNTITLTAMMGVLIPFGIWLPAALIISTLPALYVVMHFTLRQHDWRHRTTPARRRLWYLDWLLTSGESAAEVRLFGLGDHFRQTYQGLRQLLRREMLALEKGESQGEFGASLIALLVTGGALAWMVWKALRGLATLGDLALLYQAFNQGQRLMRSLLSHAGQIYSNILFLGDLFEFLELKPQVLDPPSPINAPVAPREEIRFERITFRYPDSERIALADFSLSVPAGQIAAIVGPNGAGKSTLIKLLCRLYDPESGRILIDGIDLRTMRVDEVRRLITVLFQQPVHYNVTVAENIGFGNAREDANPATIETAARASGADAVAARLPHGYETLLGKWFVTGTELSVGEWQRIALARAFVRRSPVMLLDEPTSAMDSWAEIDWMKRFRQLAGGRTTIVITHRFTTAMHADIIHVMFDGRIVESGRHDELLALDGRYAQSWKAQMQEAVPGRSSRTGLV